MAYRGQVDKLSTGCIQIAMYGALSMQKFVDPALPMPSLPNEHQSTVDISQAFQWETNQRSL